MTESLLDLNQYAYEKCAHCHLFVELVDEADALETASYIHMARGDGDDNAIEDSHDAMPSGEAHTLAWWKENGPLAMRARFEVDVYEQMLDIQEQGGLTAYPVTALVEYYTEHPEWGFNDPTESLDAFHEWLEEWERTGHGKVITHARLDRLMPTV